jgi:hypothetical protein
MSIGFVQGDEAVVGNCSKLEESVASREGLSFLSR